MSLIGLIVVLIVLGVIVGMVPMDAAVRRLVVGVLIIAVLLVLVALIFPGALPAGAKLR